MIDSRPRRARGDRGQVGGIEVLPFGFLVFVGTTLLLANLWGVIDAKFAVTAAARESVRAFVEADTLDEATTAATRRAHDTLRSFGRGGDRATVDPPELAGTFGRCVRVSITVSYDLPLIAVPFLGDLGTATPVEATHTALVDPFRSGIAGDATC